MLLRVSIDVFILPQNYTMGESNPSDNTVTIVDGLYQGPVTNITPPKIKDAIYHIPNVIDFEVSSSWDDISGSARVRIPRKLKKINVIKSSDNPLLGICFIFILSILLLLLLKKNQIFLGHWGC